MRRIGTICWLEMKRVFNNPASYALMFGMPLIFTFIFGSMLGDAPEVSRTKLAVVDMDHSAVSEAVVRQLERNDLLAISRLSFSEAESELDKKAVSGMILIPDGTERKMAKGLQTEVFFRHGPELAIAAAIQNMLDNTLAQTAIYVKSALLWSEHAEHASWQSFFGTLAAANDSALIQVKTTLVSKQGEAAKLNNTSERAISFTILFVMFTLMIVSGRILEARKLGTWHRMLSTPASRFEILGGYMTSFFIIGWIQFAVLMISTNLLFGIQWGNVLALALIVTALLLCVVGLGLFIASLVRTTEQQTALGMIVIVSTSMLGGLYWPLDMVPDVMRTIAHGVPQFWALEGFTELIARGGSLIDVAGSIGILLGFAAAFLFAGVLRVRYEA